MAKSKIDTSKMLPKKEKGELKKTGATSDNGDAAAKIPSSLAPVTATKTVTDVPTTRFTFDMPTELHTLLRMRVLQRKTSLKDYLIDLAMADIKKNP